MSTLFLYYSPGSTGLSPVSETDRIFIITDTIPGELSEYASNQVNYAGAKCMPHTIHNQMCDEWLVKKDN